MAIIFGLLEDELDELMHYGTPRHSGRYPWGSGDNPYQHESDAFMLKRLRELKAAGLKETEIAKEFDMSTTELRAMKSILVNKEHTEKMARALELKDKGYSNVKIGEIMGIPDTSVGNLLRDSLKNREDQNIVAANVLKRNVDEKGYIDVGKGVEKDLNITETRLKTAIAMAKQEGYELYYLSIPQATMDGNKTTMKVLCKPGTTYSELYKNRDKVQSIKDYIVDGTEVQMLQYPKSISSKRVMIRYGDEGGTDMDGVIQLRRGLDDVSLGNSHYAQVRIAVDGTHFLKGMALYSDDMPEGVDIIYNTNKKSGTPPEKVFKPLKDDPDNPFGATIKANGQNYYEDPNGDYIREGKKMSLGVVNKVNEEGDWNKWSKTLSSQFLSKQSEKLIAKQLDLSYKEKYDEYKEIMSLTNPAIKKKLLESFSDDCDASSVHLKATSLPGQSTKVILPITTLKDNEIYAPTYENGTKVCLVRYPHGGTFEIPTLVVNNKHGDSQRILGQTQDAVGINAHVAERLSGADFDGDTVVVIPLIKGTKITTSEPLEGLKDFNPKESYPGYEGMKVITNSRKQLEMGKVSNLITDMTIKGATPDEIARAVRHSMVVIDAEKHKLDYQRSYVENGIADLKELYQGGKDKGASTLISKASSTEYVNERKPFNINKDVDPETGKKLYSETERTYLNKNGKEVVAQMESTKMAEHDNAYDLSSGYKQEMLYAEYANKLKALANQARKDYISTENTKYSPEAKKTYAKEVDSLNAKLNEALKNAPRERQAQLRASVIVAAKKKDNPDMDKDELKKKGAQALAQERARVGANKKDVQVSITDKEWEAIQAGAISNSKLSQILNNTDLDKVKERAMPRANKELSPSKQALIKSRAAQGYTIAEIASALGVSPSTVSKYL